MRIISRERLGGLEHDVADEAVADDHVGVAVEDVAAFGVAHEVEAGLLQDAERFLRQLVALAFFLADGEQADARRFDAEEHLRVEVAHDGELAEVGGLGVDVRADVEQDGVAFRARERRRRGRDG